MHLPIQPQNTPVFVPIRFLFFKTYLSSLNFPCCIPSASSWSLHFNFILAIDSSPFKARVTQPFASLYLSSAPTSEAQLLGSGLHSFSTSLCSNQNAVFCRLLQLRPLWNNSFETDIKLSIFTVYILMFFYCCSSTAVSIPPPPLLPPTSPAPLPTLDPTPLWFCPCVLYRCSWKPSAFSPIIPSHLSSGYCQFVLNFNVSGYNLFACLFDKYMYKWNHHYNQDDQVSPGQVAQLVGVLSCTPKGYGIDPRSGHIPRLQLPSHQSIFSPNLGLVGMI